MLKVSKLIAIVIAKTSVVAHRNKCYCFVNIRTLEPLVQIIHISFKMISIN